MPVFELRGQYPFIDASRHRGEREGTPKHIYCRRNSYFPLDVVSPRDRHVGLVENPKIDKEGFIHAPTGPGLRNYGDSIL